MIYKLDFLQSSHWKNINKWYRKILTEIKTESSDHEIFKI